MNITEFAHIGQEPELRHLEVSGEQRALCKLRLSFSRSKRLEDGSYEQVDQIWLNAEAWGPLGEDIARLVVKGDRVLVKGRMKDSSWQDDADKKRFGVDLVIHELAFPVRGLQALVRRDRAANDGPSGASAAQGDRDDD